MNTVEVVLVIWVLMSLSFLLGCMWGGSRREDAEAKGLTHAKLRNAKRVIHGAA